MRVNTGVGLRPQPGLPTRARLYSIALEVCSANDNPIESKRATMLDASSLFRFMRLVERAGLHCVVSLCRPSDGDPPRLLSCKPPRESTSTPRWWM
jgi:hypothetical protein